MRNRSTSTVVNVFPLTTVLTVLFVLLKVFGKIAWSWWWVFAPVWAPIVVGILFFLALGAFFLIAAVLK